MIDVMLNDLDFGGMVLIIAVLSLFPIQLFLCFRARRMFVRLLPVMVLSASVVYWGVKTAQTGGWGGLLYLVFAAISGYMLLMCGLGWAIWGLLRLLRKLTVRR